MAFIADNFEGTLAGKLTRSIDSFGRCRLQMSNPVPNPNRAAIQAKLDAGEKPTPEIISLILKDQTGKAQGLLLKDGKDSAVILHAVCVNAFATIGWDFNRNCGWVRFLIGGWVIR
jgi:hypothetical protein